MIRKGSVAYRRSFFLYWSTAGGNDPHECVARRFPTKRYDEHRVRGHRSRWVPTPLMRRWLEAAMKPNARFFMYLGRRRR